jgi:hypothetical protein
MSIRKFLLLMLAEELRAKCGLLGEDFAERIYSRIDDDEFNDEEGPFSASGYNEERHGSRNAHDTRWRKEPLFDFTDGREKKGKRPDSKPRSKTLASARSWWETLRILPTAKC